MKILHERLLRPARYLAPCLLFSAIFLTSAGIARAADARPGTATVRTTGAVPTEDEVVALQNFVVTGSNIKRLDMEKVVPITVLDQDAMTVRQALLPVDMLTSLPSVVNLPE